MSGGLKNPEISQDKFKLAVCLIPFSITLLITLQVFLKPITFLFADDWLLLDYMIPDKKVGLSELLQLVNGHNVLTTKLCLIVLSHIFGTETLTVFAIFNLALALIACILFVHILVDRDLHPYSFITLITLCFFNFKQAQNYNMIISAHFIHSLFCIAIYLSIETSHLRKWRWIPLIIAPFTGGFGVALLVLEGSVSMKRFCSKKILNDLLNVIACSVTLFVSYGFNLVMGNSISNNAGNSLFFNLERIITRPWYLPSFLLSTLGSQFTPSSNYMSAMSQILGILVLILTYKVRKQIHENILLSHMLTLVLVSLMLFTISGYNGTFTSIENAYSNRYVTSTILITLILIISVYKSSEFPYKKLVITFLIILSVFSGLKSGIEWVNLRNSQSDSLEKYCYSESARDQNICLQMSFRQSFYTNKSSFVSDLNRFLKVHRN